MEEEKDIGPSGPAKPGLLTAPQMEGTFPFLTKD